MTTVYSMLVYTGKCSRSWHQVEVEFSHMKVSSIKVVIHYTVHLDPVDECKLTLSDNLLLMAVKT